MKEDGCLLDCCAMQSGSSLLAFQRCLLPPSSRQSHHPDEIEAATTTSEMSVNFYQTTWHNHLEDSHLLVGLSN
jgi:hypothetical protein